MAQLVNTIYDYGFQSPYSMATDGSHVWVGNYDNNTVTQFNASDGSHRIILSGPSYNFFNPRAIATDGSYVWVANFDSNGNNNTVTQFNASDGSNPRSLSGDSYGFLNPIGIATDGSHVWVANSNGTSVTQFNASDGSNPLGLSGDSYGFNYPYAIATDGSHVWVGNSNNSVTQFNASNGLNPQGLSGDSYGFQYPRAIATDGSHVWVGNYDSNTVTQFNASDGLKPVIFKNFLVNPSAICSDGENVWVVTYETDNNSLLRFSIANPTSPPHVYNDNGYGFSNPSCVASDGSSVWIGNSITGTITQVNAYTGALINLIELQNAFPISISLDISSVWVADISNNTVWQLNRQLGTVERSISLSPPFFIGEFGEFGRIPISLVSDGSSVWVLNIFNYITQLSAYDGSFVNHFIFSYNLPIFNTSISSDGSYVYVGSLGYESFSFGIIGYPYINVINTTTGIHYPSYSFDISGQFVDGIATDGTRVFTYLQKGVYEIYQNNVKNIYPLNNDVNFDFGDFGSLNTVSTDGTYTWVTDWSKSVIYQFQTFSGDNKVITYPNKPTINQSFSVSLYTPTINVIPGFKTMFVEPHQYELRQNEAILSQKYTYDSTNHIITFNEITLNSDGSHNLTWYDATRRKTLHSFTIVIRPPPPPPPPCFKADTKIYTDKGYRRIQDLRKGDLVKTATNTFIPIFAIGRRDIYHPASTERIPEQLYVCSQDQFPEVFEDLVVTGYHAILKLSFENKEEEEKTKEIYDGKICITEHLYRIPACVESKTKVYDTPGFYPIYHLALENDDYYMNYGINANGLWVETCSKRYLLEFSGMTLIQ